MSGGRMSGGRLSGGLKSYDPIECMILCSRSFIEHRPDSGPSR